MQTLFYIIRTLRTQLHRDKKVKGEERRHRCRTSLFLFFTMLDEARGGNFGLRRWRHKLD